MKINWKKPTKYSMIIAILLYLATFALAFYLGQMWGSANAILIQCNNVEDNQITSAFFTCDNEKTIQAVFFSNKAELSLNDDRKIILFQTISASGARYANEDESFVFWNKGNTAFVQENDITTYDNCITED